MCYNAINLEAAGIAGQVPVYAAGEAVESEAIKTATEKAFNTEYSVTWGEECWSKITLKKSGIVGVNFTKAESDMLGNVAMDVYVYDEKGKCITNVREEEKTVKGSVHIGLDKGVYYVMFCPEYASFVGGRTSSYKFTFTATENCEKERNDKKKDATPMKVDVTYTGYFGSGFSNISDLRDEEDAYKVQLKKGQVYQFTFDKEQGTTIVYLLGKNTDYDSFWPSTDAKDFCVSPKTTFVAPYTGAYYVKIYNYSNEQYKYKVKVSHVTPKATSLTSVKAGNDAFTAAWKKTSGSGYQIQYSTSKNFKNAKIVKVSKSKTSATVKKLSSKKKYYVRIRTYTKVDKKYKYSAWSNTKTVTTK